MGDHLMRRMRASEEGRTRRLNAARDSLAPLLLLRRYAEAERVHCRWAMLGAAGVLAQVRTSYSSFEEREGGGGTQS